MQAHAISPQPEHEPPGRDDQPAPDDQPGGSDRPARDGQPGRDGQSGGIDQPDRDGQPACDGQSGGSDQPGGDDQYAEADLERLAVEMTARGYQATVRQPAGRLPHLDVRNPRAAVMAEQVYAQADWFFWPWAQRIAPCGQPGAAAAIIARVLRADSDPAGP